MLCSTTGRNRNFGAAASVNEVDKIEKKTLPKFFCMHPSLGVFYKWMQ